MSRAPGWRRVRGFGFVALSATLYSMVDVWATMRPLPPSSLVWVLRLNLSLASLHVAAWTYYTFSDERGSFSRLEPWARWLILFLAFVCVPISLSGIVALPGAFTRLSMPELGIDITAPRTSTVGDVIALFAFAVLVLNIAVYVRRAWVGVAGARWIAAGLIGFLLCALEEFLVTSGVLRLPYLADIGFLLALVPVAWQIGTRFIDDATQLERMNTRLSGEVTERTQERDQARFALREQERLAVLGRLAAGVGHEVNHPLQYVGQSLDELHLHLTEASAEAHEALSDARDGVERIRLVVEGLRVYGTGAAPEERQSVDLRDVVRHTMRVTEPQVRHTVTAQAALGPVPIVMGDEARLVQVVVNPFVNAAQALSGTPSGRGTIQVVTRTTPDGAAEIEISDNGPGIRPEVRERLGEPYVTTRARGGGTGLGLFIT